MKIKSIENLLKIENWKLKIAFALFLFLSFSNSANATLIIQAPKYIGLNSGLVGYWSFDGKDMAGVTAYDRSGNANNGTLTNGPTRAIGKIGQGLSFDGVDDYVNAGSATSLDNLETVTYSAWIYPKGYGSGSQGHIFNKGAANWNSSFYFNSGSTLRFFWEYSVASVNSITSNTIALNVWAHVAVTYDVNGDRKAHIYINGVETSYSTQTASSGTRVDNAGESQIIGADDADATYSRFFNGLIDDVRVYNRALSGDEIKRLYRIGATLKINTSINND